MHRFEVRETERRHWVPNLHSIQSTFEKKNFYSFFFFFFFFFVTVIQHRSKNLFLTLSFASQIGRDRWTTSNTRFIYTFDLFSSFSPVQMDTQYQIEREREREKKEIGLNMSQHSLGMWIFSLVFLFVVSKRILFPVGRMLIFLVVVNSFPWISVEI